MAQDGTKGKHGGMSETIKAATSASSMPAGASSGLGAPSQPGFIAVLENVLLKEKSESSADQTNEKPAESGALDKGLPPRRPAWAQAFVTAHASSRGMVANFDTGSAGSLQDQATLQAVAGGYGAYASGMAVAGGLATGNLVLAGIGVAGLAYNADIAAHGLASGVTNAGQPTWTHEFLKQRLQGQGLSDSQATWYAIGAEVLLSAGLGVGTALAARMARQPSGGRKMSSSRRPVRRRPGPRHWMTPHWRPSRHPLHARRRTRPS